jgi:hypothetical protein
VYARRWIVFVVLAVGFFFIALNGDIYNLTSPPTLSWHVMLRKSYSIVAFALVGAALIRASGATLVQTAVAIAIYSGGIEIAQHFTYGKEPFSWNVIDVICGGVGGGVSHFIPGVRAK